jgi:hypothetical protein
MKRIWNWLTIGMFFASFGVLATDAPLRNEERCSNGSGDCLVSSPKEGSILDTGIFGGFPKTGHWISVFSPETNAPGTVGICRIFTPNPPFHWFGTEGRGCDDLAKLASDRGYDFEGFAFRARMPNMSAPNWQNPCGSGVPVFALSTGGDASYRERLVWDPKVINELRFNGWSFDLHTPLFCAEDGDARWEYSNVPPPVEVPMYTVNEWMFVPVIVYNQLIDSVKVLVGKWEVDPTRVEVCVNYLCRPFDVAGLMDDYIQNNMSFEVIGSCRGGWCQIRSQCEMWSRNFAYFRPCVGNEPEYFGWGRRR